MTRITPSVTKGHTRNSIKRNGDHRGIARDRSSRGSDDAVKTRAEAKYDGSKSVFESMIRDQERHADSLEAQLHAIKEMGIANYLAQQIDCGIGSISLNADVKAFHRLQIVRGRNSSYFGSKYKSCTVRARCFGASSPAFHERFVDHHLGGDIREFTTLPGLDLLAHRPEVPLHPVNTDRNAVDQRERFRVFGEHRREHAWDNVSKFHGES